ncbi:MAG TPA: hypothetical protein VIF57_02410 [Polyangia bacterium]|jgi:hypothetical protein
MRWLRVVIGVGVLWVISIVVTVAGLEIAHRSILAAEHGAATQPSGDLASVVSRR